jgi:hypothetical protein
MYDSFGVGSIQRIRNLDGQRQNQLGFHGTPTDAMLQRCAVQKLHGDKGSSVLIINLVDGADIGVVQGGRSLRFALESGQSLHILFDLVRQELQGDKAVQLYVLGLVNHTHPATAEFLDDAVMRDGLADQWSRILRLRNGQVNEGWVH